jgi:hemerythrin-like domain-containing protein
MDRERRWFLRASSLTAGIVLVGGCGGAQRDNSQPAARGGGEDGAPSHGDEEAQEVSPTEDLMQEHGLLERILAIYEEGARRLRSGEMISPAVLHETTAISQTFVHDYHERNEENFLFARAEHEASLAPLVQTLRAQHNRGREYAALLLRLTEPATFADASRRPVIAAACEAVVRMYRPHAARENSVLFPAVRGLYSHHDWHELGERFEDDEHRRFGSSGFEGMVSRVADIEREIGLDDLARFTAPAVTG